MSRTRMQFSLATLLLYVTCYCVMLSVASLTVSELYDQADEPHLASRGDYFRMFFSVQAALYSVAVVGMLRLGVPSRKGVNLNPGRWILLISGAAVMIGYVTSLGLVICARGGVLSLESVTAMGVVSGTVPLMVGAVVAMRNVRTSRAWTFFFGYYTVLMGATLAWGMLRYIISAGFHWEVAWALSSLFWLLPSLVAGHLVVLALAVHRDILANEVRDSLHWVGVGYVFAEHSVYILFALPQCW